MPRRDIAATRSSRVYLSPNGPPALLGRFATRSGRFVDAALDPGTLRKAMSGKSDTSLSGLMDTAEALLSEGRQAGDRPIAFVAIGFGSPSATPWAPEWGKGDWDPEKHPRWPKGTPDRQGGEFRPAGSATLVNLSGPGPDMSRVLTFAERLARRRIARAVILHALRAMAEIATTPIPIIGEADDALAGIEIGEAVADITDYTIDVLAAKQFAKEGPHDIADLMRGPPGQSVGFQSMRQFVKLDQIQLAKMYGSAGPGWEYHHIVTQGGANLQNISPELLHSTENIVRIPTLLHEAITGIYNSKISNLDLEDLGLTDFDIPESGMTLQNWLQTQPYEVQLRIGIQIMRSLGIVK
jgi:hypothetical protein